jgi:hypothetical protein
VSHRGVTAWKSGISLRGTVLMSSARTKLVSTRLTDEEYAAVERAAGTDTISAWARTALVHAATPPPRVTSTERNARGTPVEQGWNGRPPRRHEEDRRDVVPRPDDHAAAADHIPASSRASHVEWRASKTPQWSGGPGRAPIVMLTRSAAWLPRMVVVACLSAGGIAMSQYAHASTDQSLLDIAQPALWGAVAVLVAGLVPMVADDIAVGTHHARRPTHSAQR